MPPPTEYDVECTPYSPDTEWFSKTSDCLDALADLATHYDFGSCPPSIVSQMTFAQNGTCTITARHKWSAHCRPPSYVRVLAEAIVGNCSESGWTQGIARVGEYSVEVNSKPW